MLADPEIPIRMADPRDIKFILKLKRQIQIGPANQLIENYSIINALDPHFTCRRDRKITGGRAF